MKKTAYTLAELAKMLDAELRGDANCVITGIATLRSAQSGQISFLDNPRYRPQLANTNASAVILAPENQTACPTHALITKTPYLCYAKVAELFNDLPAVTTGIHKTAVIGEGCQIHASVSIGPHVVIGANVTIAENAIIGAGCVINDNCQIGSSTRLWPRVTVYHKVRIGKRVIIHSGAVIGSDGFGIAKNQGVWHKIPQIGGVVIEDDVEIGANTTIDRGALDDTVIEQGVKLDNQIQVGHNVRIGAHTAIAGCVGIAGSTTIGKRCGIGGGVGILGHITIADDVMITAGSGINKSITQSGVYSSGIDAQPAQVWRKTLVRLHQLDNTTRKLHELEKLVHELKNNIKLKEESL